MAVYCLTRTSNPDSINSPITQLESMLRKCDELGLQDPITLDEPIGTSGVTTRFRDRPCGRRLLLEARKGDTIVSYKIDRLGRNTGDIIGTIDKFTKRGVRVIVVDFLGGQPMDTISAMGRVLLAVVAAFAEYEAHVIKDRIATAKRSLKERGLLINRNSWHTIKVRNANGHGVHPEPNLEGVKTVAEIAKRKSQGETYAEIAADLWQRGVKDYRGELFMMVIPKNGTPPTNPYMRFYQSVTEFHRMKRKGLLPSPWCEIAKTIPEHPQFHAVTVKQLNPKPQKRKNITSESERDNWSVTDWRNAYESGLLD